MIYLDNAATSYPKPRAVLDKMYYAMSQIGASVGRSAYKSAVVAANEVYDTRERAASLFGISKAENIIFTQNATCALNILIKGACSFGDHVVCSDREHNSVLRPLQALSDGSVISYSIAAVDPYNDEKTVASFLSALRKNTRMVICTHVSNVTGLILPIKKLGLMCRERGIAFAVDASQSAGLLDINMTRDNIDYLCCPGHKGLYGPQGTGILAIGDDAPAPKPLTFGGTGTNSSQLIQPDFLPEALESGTLNVSGIIALGAGIDFVQKNMAKNREKEKILRKRIIQALAESGRVKLFESDANAASIVAFTLKDEDIGVTASRLAERNICIRSGLHCAPLAHKAIGSDGCNRISLGAFNTRGQVDAAVKAILERR